MNIGSIIIFSISGILLLDNNAAFAETTSRQSKNILSEAQWSGLYFGKSENEELALNLMLDPSFTEDERSVIKPALQTFMERSMNEITLNCAFQNSTKNLPASKDRFREQLYDALSYRRINDLKFPGFAYIEREKNSSGFIGSGDINLFYDRSEPSPGYKNKHYFYISINPDYLSSDSGYSFSKSIDFWAGVLGHLFLHNLGYDHPTGTSGSFINEYAQCISLNSREKMTVPELIYAFDLPGAL
jgi:hypothetical protein